ncbi:hypothetical protein MUK42_35158 [Musa troglodytarum]|uniref:Uncharacterized protein n=1 Tax=Musa troglodytarum TaxID=320322 RepID=A0A9E7G984_9LILI|nr:hypothetical protein MUK42_35158 [Musa troglodytarum]
MHKKESTLETMASRYSTMMLALLLGCLVMIAQSTNYSLHQDGDCDIRGPCKTKADCVRPCQAAGHSPAAAVLVFLIQLTVIEAQFAAALLHDDSEKRL